MSAMCSCLDWVCFRNSGCWNLIVLGRCYWFCVFECLLYHWFTFAVNVYDFRMTPEFIFIAPLVHTSCLLSVFYCIVLSCFRYLFTFLDFVKLKNQLFPCDFHFFTQLFHFFYPLSTVHFPFFFGWRLSVFVLSRESWWF